MPPQPSSTQPPAPAWLIAMPRAMSQPANEAEPATAGAPPNGWSPPQPSSTHPPVPAWFTPIAAGDVPAGEPRAAGDRRRAAEPMHAAPTVEHPTARAVVVDRDPARRCPSPANEAEPATAGAPPNAWSPPQPSSTHPPGPASSTPTPRAMSQPGPVRRARQRRARSRTRCSPPQPSSAQPPGAPEA